MGGTKRGVADPLVQAGETDPVVAILSDPAAVSDLRTEWDELLAEAESYSASMSFDYVMQGWAALPKTDDCRLAVIVARQDGRLMCVWPLHVRREGGKTVARHLGCGAHEEYAGPLFRRDVAAAKSIRAALEAARGLADLLMIYSLPTPGLASAVVSAALGRKHRVQIASPVISLKDFSDWDAWLATKSRSFRAGLRNDGRRLEKLGEVQFREMSGPVEGARLVEWLFRFKRQWCLARGVTRSWILDEQGLNFFMGLAMRAPEQRPAVADTEFYALTVDDRIIAAGAGLVSSDRLEFFVTAIDPEYGDYSPGNLFAQGYAKRAMEAGLDFDFRISQDGYKLRWVDRYDRYDSFYFACTPRGHLALTSMQLGLAIRAFRAKWGPIVKGRVKALLNRSRSRS